MRDQHPGDTALAQRNSIPWWHIAGSLALVVLLDAYEIVVTLPELSRLAGAPIFDMRIGGYDHAEAARLVDALGTEGRWFYLTRHIPADTALALIEAVAIMLIIVRATRPSARFAVAVPPCWRAALLAAPAFTLILDLGENALVAHMLGTAAAKPHISATASTLTQAKWVGASVSIALALVLPAAALVQGRRRLQPQQPSPN